MVHTFVLLAFTMDRFINGLFQLVETILFLGLSRRGLEEGHRLMVLSKVVTSSLGPHGAVDIQTSSTNCESILLESSRYTSSIRKPFVP